MFNLGNIFTRRAQTSADIEKVMEARWAGYRKYFPSRSEALDRYDHAPNTVLLLATDNQDRPIGTMRLLDGRCGEMEIEQFVNVRELLPKHQLPCAEATRFSVPWQEHSRLIKLALWKAFYSYCICHSINSMVIWIRHGATKDYEHLRFQPIGRNGVFSHPTLGNNEHQTQVLDLTVAAQLYKETNHRFHEFFCVTQHPNIRCD
jgi:hypothetical protein